MASSSGSQVPSVNAAAIAHSQIHYNVNLLSQQPYDSDQIYQELQKITQTMGVHSEIQLLRCLFEAVDFNCDAKLQKDNVQLKVLQRECLDLQKKQHYKTLICSSLTNLEHKTLKSSHLFQQLTQTLLLSRVQLTIFAVALVQDMEFEGAAKHFLRTNLPEVLSNYCQDDLSRDSGLRDLPSEFIQDILRYVAEYGEDVTGVPRPLSSAFREALRKDYPRDRVPFVLTPWLYPDVEQQARSDIGPFSLPPIERPRIDQLLLERGYGATASLTEAEGFLRQVSANDLTPDMVARCVGAMARSHTGLPEGVPFPRLPDGGAGGWDKDMQSGHSTWNVDVLVDAVSLISPGMDWTTVMRHLDYPEFRIVDPHGLHMILQAFERGSQNVMFPVATFLRDWKNSYGQLSIINQALSVASKFNFADFPLAKAAYEHLKVQPDEKDPHVMCWTLLELLTALFRLSEFGHYETVSNLFNVPSKICPDVLLLSVLQARPVNWCPLQTELFVSLVPLFFNKHENSSVVLNYTWNAQAPGNSVHNLMMKSMADWYHRGDKFDQMRLSRILDVAQELKGLLMLVNSTNMPMPFVVDLAALASRRGYLKLDKWLHDRMRDQQETFVHGCLSYIRQRTSLHGPLNCSAALDRPGALPLETITTMLACIQSYSPLSSESQDTLRALLKAFGPIPPKPRSAANSAVPASVARGGMPSVGPPKAGYDALPAVGLPPQGSMQPPVAMQPPQVPMASQPLGLHPSSDMPVDKPLGSIGTGFGGNPNMGGSSAFSSAAGAMGPFVPQPPSARTPSAPSPNTTMQPPQPPSGEIRKQAAQVPGMDATFSPEVEEEANDNFKRLYNRALTIDDVLDMLRQYKESPDTKQKDVFQCMLRNLFEEYKFFSSYPDKELQITGLLFGGLIEHNLVTYMYLGLALRYVLESLRKPSTHKLYQFGLNCLDRFKHRLKEYPQYCGHVASIPHFQEFPKNIADFVSFGKEGKEPPAEAFRQQASSSSAHASGPGAADLAGLVHAEHSMTGGGTSVSIQVPAPVSSSGAATASTAIATVLREGREGAGPSVANATNIDTLVIGMEGTGSDQLDSPPESIRDRISFLCNNLSRNNIKEKAKEFVDLLSNEYLAWAAQYLVMKRITIEQNYHDMYMQFLIHISIHKLTDMVLNETYRNIKVLLTSDKENAGFSDRSLLKNLGNWLGLMTLGQDRPILHRDLVLKDLILEAHRRGQQDLLFVVPFVTKVLDACQSSSVFGPPSPWLMANLGVLCELHALPDLKLNLKFAIEVLCKDLGIEMKEIPTYDLLNDKDRLIKEQLTTAKEKNVPPGEPGLVTQSARFTYNEVNTNGFQTMVHHIIATEENPLFNSCPQLKAAIRTAVSQAVTELMPPVVERSIKIAIATTEQIVRKDFALEADEQQMRLAAQSMVRNLTAGMVMITCREPLIVSITNHLKQALAQDINVRNYGLDKATIEAGCNLSAAENVEVACAFIQKTAVERVVSEMEKRIIDEIETRQQHRLAGRHYVNDTVRTYQMEHMPPAIRLKVTGTEANQMTVYDEFSRCLPGFLPSDGHTDFGQLMEKTAAEVDQHVRALSSSQMPSFTPFINLMTSLAALIRQVAPKHENTAAQMLLQKAVDGFLEGMPSIPRDRELVSHFRDSHLVVLHALQDPRAFGHQWTLKNTTRIWHEAREEIKYNVESVLILIRTHLIVARDLDTYVAKAIDAGSYSALVFATKYIHRVFNSESGETPMLAEGDVTQLAEALTGQLNPRHGADTSITQLSTHIRQALSCLPMHAHATAHGMEASSADDSVLPGNLAAAGEGLDKSAGASMSACAQAIATMEAQDPALHKQDDPVGMSDKVEYLLTEWVRLHHQVGYSIKDLDRMHEAYLQRLRSSNMLKSDESITRFFRISTELCVELCYRNLQGDVGQGTLLSRAKCYHTMDAFVKLAIVFLKHSGEPNNVTARVSLLGKILQTVAYCLLKDHTQRMFEFHQLPYHRFFSMLLLELSMSGLLAEVLSFHVMQTFCSVFRRINPQTCPGFAYGWLELISHRVMLTKLLGATNQKGWPLFQQLLLDMMKFMAPFLRNAELPKSMQHLYKGLLRVLLVLLHDFPEFLCDYHFVFCDVVPPNCIQMRNLILSAFPRNMRLPDPFTPNLKVDQLTDISQQPRLLVNFAASLHPPALRNSLENFLKPTGHSSNFHAELLTYLQQTQSDDTSLRYNVPLLNAVVLYTGTQAVNSILSKNATVTTQMVANNAHMSIFQHLITNLDTEGRYLLLNSIGNQLRYPNCHTHYFSCVLLHLFVEASCEAVQEQITRVLLERLIVNRPHPWGLLITFIELIKNPMYSFWSHQFVHCAPEIEKLFESVARSCTQSKPAGREIVEGHD